MKKIQLRVFQAFVMVMLAVSSMALVSCDHEDDVLPTVNVDGINYILNDDNSATVTVGNYIGSVTVPGAIESGDRRYQVKKVGNGAFMSCTELTEVTLPNTVVYIDNHAFDGCANLTDITIPANVTYIGSYAFNGCNLDAIIIPDNVTVVGAYAYAGNTAVKYLEIGKNVNTINWCAFKGCPIETIICANPTAPRLDYYPESDEWPFDATVLANAMVGIPRDASAASFVYGGGWSIFYENDHMGYYE